MPAGQGMDITSGAGNTQALSDLDNQYRTLFGEFQQQYAAPQQTQQSLAGGLAGELGGFQREAQGLWQNDPGRQFLLDKSEKAIGRAAAARGMNLSGNVLLELQKNAMGIADQGFQGYLGNLLGERNFQFGIANQLADDRARAAQARDLALLRFGQGTSGDILNMYGTQLDLGKDIGEAKAAKEAVTRQSQNAAKVAGFQGILDAITGGFGGGQPSGGFDFGGYGLNPSGSTGIGIGGGGSPMDLGTDFGYTAPPPTSQYDLGFGGGSLNLS